MRVRSGAGDICATVLRLLTKHRAQRGEAAVMFCTTVRRSSPRRQLLRMQGRHDYESKQLEQTRIFERLVQSTVFKPENLRLVSSPPPRDPRRLPRVRIRPDLYRELAVETPFFLQLLSWAQKTRNITKPFSDLRHHNLHENALPHR